MSVVLSEHLPLLASAPAGIQKLRGLILELAVRGKLVPQDPDDEPASQLLKQIGKERAQLEADGTCKKSKETPDMGEDERPFALPDGWAWGRIKDIANSQAGFAFKSSSFNDAQIGMPLIRIRDVGFSDPSTYFDGPYREEFVVTKGDYLVSMDGQFRVAEWKGKNALLNQRVSRLQFYSRDLAQAFFAISLHIRLGELQGIKAYTTVDHLSGGQISSAVIGVPPLAEQHRIVAKVDELMALCDRLEAEQADSTNAHARLVETLLGTLTQSTDAADLAANWQRLAEHFDSLFSTEASIDALKQSVLQLAVMGKLVPQNLNDEPASELLRRIAKLRSARLAKDYPNPGEASTQIKKQEKQRCPQNLVKLPKGWSWATLMQCSELVVDCHNKTAPYSLTGIPLLRTTNIRDGALNFREPKFVSPDIYERWSARCKPEPYDLLITREAPMGEVCIIPDGMTVCMGQRIMLIRLVQGTLAPKFLLYSLLDPNLMDRVQDKPVGATVEHLRVGGVETLLVALPPLAEQHRIVAKIDELMALCDHLKGDLAKSSSQQARLSATLIETALEAA